jgi:hypothetical protein
MALRDRRDTGATSPGSRARGRRHGRAGRALTDLSIPHVRTDAPPPTRPQRCAVPDAHTDATRIRCTHPDAPP